MIFYSKKNSRHIGNLCTSDSQYDSVYVPRRMKKNNFKTFDCKHHLKQKAKAQRAKRKDKDKHVDVVTKDGTDDYEDHQTRLDLIFEHFTKVDLVELDKLYAQEEYRIGN